MGGRAESAKQRAQRILSELAREVSHAAEARAADANAFGWRARRCAECVLLLLIAERAPERLDGLRFASLDKLLTQDVFAQGKVDQLDRDVRTAIEGIRDHGNALVHVQIDELDAEYNARIVATKLAKLIRAFYGSRLKDAPRALDACLSAIEDPASPVPPGPRREAATLVERRRASALVAGLAALLGLAFGVPLGMNLAPRAPAPQPSAPQPAPTDVPVTPLAAAPDVPVVENETAAPQALLDCPDDSVAVPPMRFHLRAVPTEDRPTWPGLQRAPSPTERSVDGFCLQRRPLTRAEVARLDPAIPTAFPGCRRGDPAPHAPLGCLLRAEAVRLCAQWAPGGRLPTSLEWEAIVRAAAESPALQIDPWRSANTVPDSLEWTADAFPAPWLARGDARPGDWMTRGPIPPSPRGGDHAWSSWNHHAEGRVHNLYVRCALSR